MKKIFSTTLKKTFTFASFLLLFNFFFSAQESTFSDDDLFSDDDFFGEDSLIDIEETQTGAFSSDLNHGILFENGNIKIGGTFDTEISSKTVLYEDSDDKFVDHIYKTVLTPKAEALLTLDARPTQILRMYSKFGLAYPFETSASSLFNPLTNSVTTSVSDYFVLKELFTDFSFADRLFFRFGKHTVTWGTGYFFSPVSDMINTSSIDPEDTDAEINGCLNLRAQITFPGTQNCLWFYLIPSTDFISSYSASSYARETALAAKADLVFGGWEFGGGAYWKYHSSPKAMLTASGSIIHGKVSVFGEAVYQYGTETEWNENTDFSDKTSLFLVTAGTSYYWKIPQITFAFQAYYDSYSDKDFNLSTAATSDILHNYFYKGWNLAGLVNFGRVFGTEDFTVSLFGMVNFGKEELSSSMKSMMASYGMSSSYLSAGTFSAMLNYTPFKNLTLGAGPYMTFSDWGSAPVLSLKLTASLGGGKF